MSESNGDSPPPDVKTPVAAHQRTPDGHDLWDCGDCSEGARCTVQLFDAVHAWTHRHPTSVWGLTDVTHLKSTLTNVSARDWRLSADELVTTLSNKTEGKLKGRVLIPGHTEQTEAKVIVRSNASRIRTSESLSVAAVYRLRIPIRPIRWG
jgi:hypothetical protein